MSVSRGSYFFIISRAHSAHPIRINIFWSLKIKYIMRAMPAQMRLKEAYITIPYEKKEIREHMYLKITQKNVKLYYCIRNYNIRIKHMYCFRGNSGEKHMYDILHIRHMRQYFTAYKLLN